MCKQLYVLKNYTTVCTANKKFKNHVCVKYNKSIQTIVP